jgi:hypothetical protein
LEQEILSVCHQAVEVVIGPKIRNLRDKTETKVRADLAKHFPDRAILERNVASSELILQLDALAFRAVIQANPSDGAGEYAGRILAAWTDVQAFEKNHLA